MTQVFKPLTAIALPWTFLFWGCSGTSSVSSTANGGSTAGGSAIAAGASGNRSAPEGATSAGARRRPRHQWRCAYVLAATQIAVPTTSFGRIRCLQSKSMLAAPQRQWRDPVKRRTGSAHPA